MNDAPTLLAASFLKSIPPNNEHSFLGGEAYEQQDNCAQCVYTWGNFCHGR